MYSNIFFVGGIHGAGKGKTCADLSKNLGLEYLSASELINWLQLSPEKGNKNVSDIPATQELLVSSLKSILSPKKKYILDGHFCLFNHRGDIQNIAPKVFQTIAPIAILVITCEPAVIQKRLVERDNKMYRLSSLHRMQRNEIEHGQLIAQIEGVPFHIVKCDEVKTLEEILTKHL